MTAKKVSCKKMSEAYDRLLPVIKTKVYRNIFAILEEFGIGVHTVDRRGSQLLWYVAGGLSFREDEQTIGCMEYLIDQGADVNHVDFENFTVLHMAAMRSNGPAVQLLIDKGAVVDALTVTDLTPLDLAMANIEATGPEAISVLLKAGADPYRKYAVDRGGFITPADSAERFAEEVTMPLLEQRDAAARCKQVFFDTIKEMGLK